MKLVLTYATILAFYVVFAVNMEDPDKDVLSCAQQNHLTQFAYEDDSGPTLQEIADGTKCFYHCIFTKKKYIENGVINVDHVTEFMSQHLEKPKQLVRPLVVNCSETENQQFKECDDVIKLIWCVNNMAVNIQNK